MKQAVLATLENKYIMVESQLSDNVQYAIEKELDGLHVISGGQVLSINADNIEKFAGELLEVWKMYRKD